MPRIITSHGVILDFCKRHFPKLDYAKVRFMDMGRTIRGNEFKHKAAHPDYDVAVCRCHMCNTILTGDDK